MGVHWAVCSTYTSSQARTDCPSVEIQHSVWKSNHSQLCFSSLSKREEIIQNGSAQEWWPRRQSEKLVYIGFWKAWITKTHLFPWKQIKQALGYFSFQSAQWEMRSLRLLLEYHRRHFLDEIGQIYICYLVFSLHLKRWIHLCKWLKSVI